MGYIFLVYLKTVHEWDNFKLNELTQVILFREIGSKAHEKIKNFVFIYLMIWLQGMATQ